MKTKVTHEPHDRLTRLAGVMTEALDADPEHGDEKCVVFLQDGDRGGMVLHGYEDHREAVADVLVHLQALLAANGYDLQIMTMPDDASALGS